MSNSRTPTPSSIDPESIPQRTTRRMAREAGGLQTPKLQWSSRSKSPTKDSTDIRSVTSIRDKERERELERGDGLILSQTKDPRKKALNNSLNQQASSPSIIPSSTQKYQSSRKSSGGMETQGERNDRVRERLSERKKDQVRTNIGSQHQEDENPFLEPDSENRIQLNPKSGGISARRVTTKEVGTEDRGTTNNKADSITSLQSRNPSSTTPARRVRSIEPASNISSSSSRPQSTSRTSAGRLQVPSSTSPSAVRLSSHQNVDQISPRKPATRVLSPEKRSKISTSTPHGSEDQKYQISNTSEDALKRIERRLQNQVSSSSKYLIGKDKVTSEAQVEERSYQRKRERDQSSPSKTTNSHHHKEQEATNPKLGTFPSISSFGEENESIQSLAPTTPSPGGLSPSSSSPNTIGHSSKISPSRKNDYFGGRMNDSPSKPIDLQSLKPSPGKAKRGCFREDESSDEESELQSQPLMRNDSRMTRNDTRSNQEINRKVEDSERKPRARPSLSRGESISKSSMSNAHSSSTIQDPSKPSSKLSSISSETSRTLAEIEAALKSFKESSPRKRPQTSIEKREEVENNSSPTTMEVRSSKVLSPHRKWAEERKNQTSALNKPAKDLMENPFTRNTRANSSRVEGGGGSSFMDQLKRVDRKRREQSGEMEKDLEKESRYASKEEVGTDREEADSEANPNENESRSSRYGEEKPREMDLKRLEEESERERKRLLKARTDRRRSVPTISSSSSSHELEDVDLSSDKPPVQTELSSTATSQSKEEKKATKAARRKSLYSYNPTKKEEWVNVTQGLESNSVSTNEGTSTPVTIVTGHELSVAEIHPSRRAMVETSTSTSSSSQTPTKQGSPTKTKSTPSKSSTFLRGLIILVDVRDQDGSDASHRWVELLKAGGAKVYLKPPSSSSKNFNKLTHIVYKAGKNITRTFYRELDQEFKPLVVGIGWVSKSMELGRKVDEKEYIVELGKEAIFSQVSFPKDPWFQGMSHEWFC